MRVFNIVGPLSWDWFRIPPLSLKTPDNLKVHGSYTWGLPGVKCPECGIWSGRLPLPGFDLGSFAGEDELRSGWVASIDEFRRIVGSLRAFLGARLRPEIKLEPGTYFGPLAGSVSGRRCGDFQYIFNDTILVTRVALASLQARGIRGLVGVEPQLRRRGKLTPNVDLLELHVEPRARVADRSMIGREPDCGLCGRTRVKEYVTPLTVRRTSIPEDVDVFRAAEKYNEVIVTEAFMNVVLEEKMTNIKFLELGVED